MTAHDKGMRTEQIAPVIPPGLISHSQRWVRVVPVSGC